MSLTIHVDTSALDALLAKLEDDVDASVRPAAQAGVQVLYDRIKANVDQIKPKTGNLAASIYQVYSRDNSGRLRATYHTSWNAKKAPHGHLVEYGHFMRYRTFFDQKKQRWVTDKRHPIAPRKVGAMPFVRPAQSSFGAALEAASENLMEALLARGGRWT